MWRYAEGLVFWPGISKDIDTTRATCGECNRVAPSQAQQRTPNSAPPKTPFQQLAADNFELKGHHYLVTADRLSGWLDITHADKHNRGAKGLIAALRRLFATYGVPEELATDSSTEFTSAETTISA